MLDPNHKSNDATRHEFRQAMWLIAGISLFWILGMIWANLGAGALVLVTLSLNSAITRLQRNLPPPKEKPD
ncbi:MAG: hypothetical protein ACRBBV_02910 [Paracoccaceae bacterium]